MPRALLAAALAGLVLAPGCLGPRPDIAADATAEAGALLRELLGHLFDPGGRFAHAEGVAGYDATMEYPAGSTTAGLRWGRDGSFLETQTAGVIDIASYCNGTGYFTRVGDEVYQSRPARGIPCGAGRIEGMPANASEYHLSTARSGGEGVNASFDFPPGGSLHLDGRRGHLASFRVESGGTSATYTLVYAERESQRIPPPTQRLPADAKITWTFGDHAFAAQVTGGDEQPPLSDLELRAVSRSAASNGTLLATFPLDQSRQDRAGMLFQLEEKDGDGHLTAGDQFRVTNPDWSRGNEVDLGVWDRWAQRDLRERRIQAG